VDKNDPRVARLLEEVKTREGIGYAYEGADASFELLARRLLGEVPRYFTVDSFRVMVEKRHNALGQLVTVSEATVKVFVNGSHEPVWSVAEGNGPVNALDAALRKALFSSYPELENIHLADYKVRILNENVGTAATTRVLIESSDGEKEWGTIGVSENIVEASWEALLDGYVYGLLHQTR
jgi:2-isopropylmalate synthase